MEEQSQNNEEVIEEVTKEEKKNNGGSAFYKQKLAEMEAENRRLQMNLESEITAKLKEKEDYKLLWEREKEKREEAERNAGELKGTIFNTLKSNAIKQEALKVGIVPSALDDIDLVDNSMVQVETTDRGTMRVLGTKDFIEVLKETRPHWFKTVGAPNVNVSTPGEPEQKKEYSAADIIEIQKKDPAKYREIMSQKFRR